MDHDDRAPNAPADGELAARYDPTCESVRFVRQRGKSVYRISVDHDRDLRQRGLTCERFLDVVLSVGEILAMPPGVTDPDCLPAEDRRFSFIFASVLSGDLLVETMGLPPRQVELLAEPVAGSCRTTRGGTFPRELMDSEPLTAETACGLPIGEILIRLGADALAIAWALRQQIQGDNRPIGDILVLGGQVGVELRDEAVRLQQAASRGEMSGANACVSCDQSGCPREDNR